MAKKGAAAAGAGAGEAAPAPAQPPPARGEKLIFAGLFGLLLLPSLYCYRVYGYHFFVPNSLTRLRHSPGEWQAMLRNRSVLLIGGPHRGGTSVLWELLSAHPEISAFGSTRETGSDHSEGIFVQSVYPRFGIGTEFARGKEGGRGSSAWKPVGLGRYALGPEPDIHWTEAHPAVTPQNQARLLNEFGRFWELSHAPVLVEKVRGAVARTSPHQPRGPRSTHPHLAPSRAPCRAVVRRPRPAPQSPPNAVISRFLQALLNLGNAGWEPSPPNFGGASSVAKFVFISRHPLANA